MTWGAARDQHANTAFEAQCIWQLNFSNHIYLISFIKQYIDRHVHIGLLDQYMSDRRHISGGLYLDSFCEINFFNVGFELGAHSGGIGSGTALQAGRSRVRCPMASLEFFIDIIFPAYYGTRVDSPFKKMSTGIKAAGV